MNKSVPLPFPYFFLIALTFFGFILYLNFQTRQYRQEITSWINLNASLDDELNAEESKLKGFLINTKGCKIPDMDPFDESVKKYIDAPKSVVCNNGTPPLFISDDTTISMNKSALPYYFNSNSTDLTKLSCCYRTLWRVPPKHDKADTKIVYDDVCEKLKLSGSTTIPSEFIKVTCSIKGNDNLYEDYFSFVPPKAMGQSGKGGVLVIGLDAVSRVNLHRQMPLTVDYLKSELGAIELLGYNKVGDNTFPNLIPMLTGMSEAELRNACWPHDHDRFDKCPFIWNTYKKKGYLTAYGEDASWMGLFNYQRYGFRNQPTDYDYAYFARLAENRIGNAHEMNVNRCVGGREAYIELLDYIGKFTRSMANYQSGFFGFFWGASLSHDYLNRPALGDPIYKEFFRGLREGGYLNDTWLWFVSDHGIRWGGIRQTFQGRMEERLPFVFVVPPQGTEGAKVDNLKRNARRLTTPFDVHETLKDIVLEGGNQLVKDVDASQLPRGISLFSRIPETRTCESAEISSHWCTCQSSVEVPIMDSHVVASAAYAVENINFRLSGYADCAKLKLSSIQGARKVTHSHSDLTKTVDYDDYTLTLTTTPGDAVFEVTVRSKHDADPEHKMDVIGTISRLNLYGNQSRCISDFHLKLYCYCL